MYINTVDIRPNIRTFQIQSPKYVEIQEKLAVRERVFEYKVCQLHEVNECTFNVL